VREREEEGERRERERENSACHGTVRHQDEDGTPRKGWWKGGDRDGGGRIVTHRPPSSISDLDRRRRPSLQGRNRRANTKSTQIEWATIGLLIFTSHLNTHISPPTHPPTHPPPTMCRWSRQFWLGCRTRECRLNEPDRGRSKAAIPQQQSHTTPPPELYVPEIYNYRAIIIKMK
jgi:hypothetical protein